MGGGIGNSCITNLWTKKWGQVPPGHGAPGAARCADNTIRSNIMIIPFNHRNYSLNWNTQSYLAVTTKVLVVRMGEGGRGGIIQFFELGTKKFA